MHHMQAKRYFPSSFDPRDPTLKGIALPLSWRWVTIEHSLKTWGSRGVMMRLPLFWQLEVPIFDACQSVGAFLFTNDQDNMPLGAEAVRTADIDTVITDASDAAQFSAFLASKHIALPPNWFIVCKPGERAPQSLQHIVRIVEELHESPGISRT